MCTYCKAFIRLISSLKGLLRLKCAYMNEQLRAGGELTGRGVSSRLNEAPFSNRGNFAMPESHSPEQPQGNAVRGQERTHILVS